jgi:hypothetical protein
MGPSMAIKKEGLGFIVVVQKCPLVIRDCQKKLDGEKLVYQFSLVSKMLSALVPRAAQARKYHLGNNFLPQDAPGTVAWSSCSKD